MVGYLLGVIVFLLIYNGKNWSYKFLYIGDFFLFKSCLVEGLLIVDLWGFKLDVLIVEGSYGIVYYLYWW